MAQKSLLLIKTKIYTLILFIFNRNLQEKSKWYNVFNTVAQANKFETEIDRVI